MFLKTYPEIDQTTIVYQAANRQNHIDQGQSVNVMVHPDMPIKEVNNIYVTAWKLGVKIYVLPTQYECCTKI